MAHVADRWTRPGPPDKRGRPTRVRTDRYGRGSRWLAVWYEPDGTRRKKAFDNKDAAQAHLENVGHSKRSGTYVGTAEGRITVQQWITTWFPGQTHLKPSGRERVKGIIDRYILPRWGTVALADITHEDVQDWVNTLPGAPATVHRIHGVLAKALDGAVRVRRLARNEARMVNLPERVGREHRYLTVAELDRLLAQCGPWAPFTRCLALTGLRVGEAAELRVRDVQLDRRRVSVARSTTTLAGRRVTGTPKSAAGRRNVPLPAEVRADIGEAITGKARDDLVYVTPRGAQVRKDNYRRAFVAAARAAGLEGLRPHDLRHTAVSLAVAAGASVKTVQRMVGHTSAAITLDVYAGLFDQELDDVIDRVDALLAAQRSPQPAPSGGEQAA